MIKILPADKHEHLEPLHRLITDSFLTVAREFKLNKKNAPTNPAFLTKQRLKEYLDKNIEVFIAVENHTPIGCVAIEPDSTDSNRYFIERLAVLPSYRHKGIGRELLDKAIQQIRCQNASVAGVAIINDNNRLKNWYKMYGFHETGTRVFNHLPFTVCFMEMKIL